MRFVKTAESIFDIPSGFVRVAYLESTGTQYIDTGITSNLNTSAEINLNVVAYSTNNTATFFGGFTSNTGISTNISKTNIDRYSRFGTKYTVIKNLDIEGINSKITIDKNAFVINGQSYIVEETSSFNGPNMYLFKVAGVTSEYNTTTDIYSCKIWDNGTLVRDFIPCIDSLGIPCMYDLVGKKAYYNQGTGEFTVGRQIIPVEYLESTGTQHIDVPYIPKDTSGLRAIWSYSDDSDRSIAGARWSSGSSGRWFIGHYSFGLYFGWNSLVATVATSANTFYDCKLNMYNDRKVYLDGVEQTTISTTLDTSSMAAMKLFYIDHAATKAIGKLKLCQVTEGNELIYDFIPCKDENNVGFMFDTLSGTVYENAGTGAFVVGQNKYKMKLRLIRDNILPTGYTQVEYLETTNQQNNDTSTNAAAYIDTGIIPNDNTKLECRMQFTTLISGNSREALNGTTSTGQETAPRFAWGFASVSPYRNFYFGFGAQNLTTSVTRDTNVHTFVLDAKNKTCSIDDTTESFTSSRTIDSSRSIYLFARHGSIEYANKPCNAKLYYCKILENDVLVRNFIPAIDPSGTPCLYDLVSKTPFYSEGTGTFTTGKPVLPIVRFPVDPVPVGYKTVNYLESTGTQYIDTGVTGNNNIKLQTKIYSTAINKFIFGSRVSAATDGFGLFVHSNDGGSWFPFFSNSKTMIPGFTIDNDYIIEFSKDGLIVNGTLLQGPYDNTFTNALTMKLFAMDTNGTVDTRMFIGKMYNCQIYDNNTLIRNFIPVIRLLDNKAGMWDTVTKQFYTTPVGDFITG